MTDMLKTVEPKSSQLNADDLIAGQSKVIRITKVSKVSGEQPIAINYEGDGGKPYMPCKSMRRVLIHAWGGDGNAYVGRKLTLYCDPTVKFGGADVGGIRISSMSDIKQQMTVALTVTKANRKPFTVQPLIESIDDAFEALKQAGRTAAAGGGAALDAWLKTVPVDQKKRLTEFGPELRKLANEVDNAQQQSNS